MKSAYIAGPYSAEHREGEDKNIKNAVAVAAEYVKAGYAIFCPHSHSCQIARDHDIDDWNTWLILDLYWLSKCDIVVFLPGWKESKGASIEHMVARGLSKEIVYLEEATNERLSYAPAEEHICSGTIEKRCTCKDPFDAGRCE